jgi:hypothetical protein
VHRDVTWCFLHTDSLTMFQGVIFFKAASFVKWHNTKLTNICCFTPLFVRRTDPTLPYWILLFSLSPTYCFPQPVLVKISESLPGGSSEGPLGVGLFSEGTALSSSLLESTMSAHSLIQFLVTVEKFLVFLFPCSFVQCFVHQK